MAAISNLAHHRPSSTENPPLTTEVEPSTTEQPSTEVPVHAPEEIPPTKNVPIVYYQLVQTPNYYYTRSPISYDYSHEVPVVYTKAPEVPVYYVPKAPLNYIQPKAVPSYYGAPLKYAELVGSRPLSYAYSSVVVHP